jgi:hypothetical protein
VSILLIIVIVFFLLSVGYLIGFTEGYKLGKKVGYGDREIEQLTDTTK